MKRFTLLLALAGTAFVGFLLWKRREVGRAAEISQDPWPSVVAETHAALPSEDVKPETKGDVAAGSDTKDVKTKARKRTKKVSDANSD
jgi:hypothetical protein